MKMAYLVVCDVLATKGLMFDWKRFRRQASLMLPKSLVIYNRSQVCYARTSTLRLEIVALQQWVELYVYVKIIQEPHLKITSTMVEIDTKKEVLWS